MSKKQTEPRMTKDLVEAANEYGMRRARLTHPDGEFDYGGRWYPSEYEHCECCEDIREPSRAWPLSRMMHCRSSGHLSALTGYSARDIKRAYRRLMTMSLVDVVKRLDPDLDGNVVLEAEYEAIEETGSPLDIVEQAVCCQGRYVRLGRGDAYQLVVAEKADDAEGDVEQAHKAQKAA